MRFLLSIAANYNRLIVPVLITGILILFACRILASEDVHREPTVSAIILVHGAWHGGWTWNPVALRLRHEGHRVYAPTLSGMSLDDTAPVAEIRLSTHIDDVVSILEDNRLSNVILVGHSYGGIVISGVLGRNTGRVAKAVYLDAVVIEDGQSLVTGVNDITPALRAGFEQHAKEGAMVPPPPMDTWESRWGITEEHMEYARQHIRPHPPLT